MADVVTELAAPGSIESALDRLADLGKSDQPLEVTDDSQLVVAARQELYHLRLRTGTDVWQELEDLFAKYEGTIEIEAESGCLWSAKLRLIMEDAPGRSSRSEFFCATGGMTPGSVASRAMVDALAWLNRAGQEPMSASYWLDDIESEQHADVRA